MSWLNKLARKFPIKKISICCIWVRENRIWGKKIYGRLCGNLFQKRSRDWGDGSIGKVHRKAETKPEFCSQNTSQHQTPAYTCIPVVGGGDRRSLGTCSLASLPKLMSFRFSGRWCLKTIQMHVRWRNDCESLMTMTSLYKSVWAHTCTTSPKHSLTKVLRKECHEVLLQRARWGKRGKSHDLDLLYRSMCTPYTHTHTPHHPLHRVLRKECLY